MYTKGDGAPLPQAFLYGDGGCVEKSLPVLNGPAVTGLLINSELERVRIPGFLKIKHRYINVNKSIIKPTLWVLQIFHGFPLDDWFHQWLN